MRVLLLARLNAGVYFPSIVLWTKERLSMSKLLKVKQVRRRLGKNSDGAVYDLVRKGLGATKKNSTRAAPGANKPLLCARGVRQWQKEVLIRCLACGAVSQNSRDRSKHR